MGITRTDFQFNEKAIQYIQDNFSRPSRFRMVMWSRLPLGFFCGLRMREITREQCKVSVRYKWLNKNPFKSTFWAVLGMAAEMSSGALLLMYTNGQKPSFATLVTGTTAKYYKKALGTTTFVCTHGKAIAAAVSQAAVSGEGVEVVCPMTGYNEAGEVVAEFTFTWSIKARKSEGGNA